MLLFIPSPFLKRLPIIITVLRRPNAARAAANRPGAAAREPPQLKLLPLL